MPEEVKQPIPTQEAYIQNMVAMNNIIAHMKEIPVLPSEQPKDVHALQKVEFPEEGGILTYMEGYDQPYRGFPFAEFVDKIDIIKKNSRAVLSGLYHSLKNRNIFTLLTLLPSVWVAKDIVWTGVYAFYRMIERFKIKPIMYSGGIRELHRAFSVPVEGESIGGMEKRLMLRDLVCMVFEFDNAYRFRVQDLLVEIDKYSFNNNPRKELLRILDLAQEREIQQDIKDTHSLIKMAVKYYLLFDRKLLKIIKSTIIHLDYKKFGLSIEDKFYCRPRKDYKFRFMVEPLQTNT